MTPESFLQLSDLLPEPTLLVSAGGIVHAANRATNERLGVSPAALRGRPLADAVTEPADEVGRYLRACCRSRQMVIGALTVAGGIACRAEGAVARPAAGGAEGLVLLRLVPKESAAGKFVALNLRIEELGKEIRRRQAAEDAVRRQEEWLRVTLSSIGDAVIATDAEARVTFMNGVAESLTGWNQAEARGRPLPEVFRIVNEHTREPAENPALRALREGRVVGLANHTVLISRDGAERPIDDSAAPMRDGRIVGAVLVFRDATEWKQTEAAIRASEERLRRMVNVDGVGVLVWVLPEGRLTSANDFFLRMFGYTRAEVEAGGLTWRTLTPPEYIAASEEQLAGFAVTGRIGPYEKEYYRKDGSRAWMVFAGANLGDGTVVEYCIDVSDRKRAEAALREADRKKDDFIALLAHELRNPLAPIRNGLQVIRMSDERAARDRSQAMMDRQLTHMVRMIDDLLDVSRINRNKMELRRARVALAEVVSTAVETAGPAVAEGGHELSVSLPGVPVFLDADLTRLAQVFGNLLTNSAKYTPPGGKIWLTAERQGSEAVVTVRDTGIGIPERSLPAIFDMFSQVNRSIERSTGGLGIGLALVKGLVEMHGGTVAATSEGEGKGSTFTVSLPVAGDAREPAAEASEGRRHTRPGRRVLVVDDNHDGADSMADMLRLLGDEVCTAHDGEEAIDEAGRFRPDVILMDVGMPRLNGLDATRRIRERPWGKEITIIALTGWGQEGDRARSRDAGCDGHLVKPVNLADLEKLLGELRAGRG